MLTRVVTVLLVAAFASMLGGCASLPSAAHVQQKFNRENPSYTVLNVSESFNRSPRATIDDKAVFRVSYTVPGDPRTHLFERHFGRVAEGWIEVPPKTPPR